MYRIKEGTGCLLERIMSNNIFYPEKVALSDIDSELTYSNLVSRVDYYVRWLETHEFRPGQVVILQLPNKNITVALMLAFFKAQVIPLFAAPTLREREVSHLLKKSGADYYFFSTKYGDIDYFNQADKIREDEGAEFDAYGVSDDNVILYFLNKNKNKNLTNNQYIAMMTSSGSTGLPKIIPLTHERLLQRANKWISYCQISPESRFMAYLSIMYPMTLHSPGILATLISGGSVFLTDRNEHNVRRCLNILTENKITHSALVPSFANEFIKEMQKREYDLSALEVIEIGGEPLTNELAKGIKKAFNVNYLKCME